MPENLSLNQMGSEDLDFEIPKEEIKRGESLPSENYYSRGTRLDTRRKNPSQGRGKFKTLDGKYLRSRPMIGGKDTWGKDDFSEKRPGKPGYKEKYPEKYEVNDYDSVSDPIGIQAARTENRKYENYGEYQQYKSKVQENEKFDKKFPDRQRPRPVSGEELRKEQEYQEEKHFGNDKILPLRSKKRKILGVLR